jgi:hypothetical protein
MKKHTVALAFAMMSALAIPAALMAAAGGEERQSSDRAQARTIQGVWRTVVTQRNCQTDAPVASFMGSFTFNEGGTMSEYGIGPGGSPARRSPGHGVWQREHGWQDYSFAFMLYNYDANGIIVGSQKVTAALDLFPGGDEFASRSAIEVLDVNGNVTVTRCATTVGTRFE